MEFFSKLGVSEFTLTVISAIILLVVIIIVKFLKSDHSSENSVQVQSYVPKKTTRLKARHFSRIPVSINTFFTIADETVQVPCKIVDISISGLRFICKEDIQKRTRVRISLPNINDALKIKDFIVPGEIVRNTRLNQTSFEHGVEFLHILKTNMDLLELIVNNPDKVKNIDITKKSPA